MHRFIALLIQPRVSRLQYWAALTLVGLVGGGVLLLQQSPAGAGSGLMWAAGISTLILSAALMLLILFKRVKDTGLGWLPWVLVISVGGRLAKAAVQFSGGSRHQGDLALGAVMVLALVGLGSVPGRREEPVGTDEGGADAPP
jgi:uncharacterized membrane protein YhaH (DUF805 family)